MPKEKEYLGDSVYADVNEYGAIVLTTENGLPDDPSNEIIMESFVVENLKRFAERHKII